MPKSKIVVGMPLYGKAWTLPSSARNGKTPGPGMFAQGVDQVGWKSIILYYIYNPENFEGRWEQRLSYANLRLELCPVTYCADHS